MGNGILENGKSYSCEARNEEAAEEEIREIKVSLKVKNEEITIETRRKDEEKGQKAVYVVSSKFQGQKIGEKESFMMYALGKKTKTGKIWSPNCFIREYADGRGVIVIRIKGVEYEGEMK